jgi:hypothetical protein
VAKAAQGRVGKQPQKAKGSSWKTDKSDSLKIIGMLGSGFGSESKLSFVTN